MCPHWLDNTTPEMAETDRDIERCRTVAKRDGVRVKAGTIKFEYV